MSWEEVTALNRTRNDDDHHYCTSIASEVADISSLKGRSSAVAIFILKIRGVLRSPLCGGACAKKGVSMERRVVYCEDVNARKRNVTVNISIALWL